MGRAERSLGRKDHRPLWWRVLRSLGPLASRIPFPVLRGPLMGLRLYAVCRSSFFLGTYEPQMTRCWISLLRSGAVVYDIGAHIGWFTLIGSRLVGSQGRVYAFEPLPFNIWILHRHLQINRITNVTLMPLAVSDRIGAVTFAFGATTGTGHISPDASFLVPTSSLDHLLTTGQILPPSVIKIDVEGAEGSVLNGAKNLLSQFRPTLLIEQHGSNSADYESFLLSLGYQKKMLRWQRNKNPQAMYKVPPERL
ncbi:MAG: FkbM family methyltransferase [Armatimonadetes bacterium]|nr:FkbM family methyltransferase [Armatimonadota bacterium]MDW8121048.1 FkbM family methyltransferase [Armatimonadota bacterium]